MKIRMVWYGSRKNQGAYGQQHVIAPSGEYRYTVFGKKLHHCYFLNNFVKSRSTLIILGAQIRE